MVVERLQRGRVTRAGDRGTGRHVNLGQLGWYLVVTLWIGRRQALACCGRGAVCGLRDAGWGWLQGAPIQWGECSEKIGSTRTGKCRQSGQVGRSFREQAQRDRSFSRLGTQAVQASRQYGEARRGWAGHADDSPDDHWRE